VPSAEVVLMPRSRHFPFLDEATLFNDVLLRFLKAQSSTSVMPTLITRERQPVP
jgi:hypothetical protein